MTKKEKIIKGYKVQGLVGKGGMAAIYLAKNIATGEDVALKVLLSHIASDRDYVLRFLHEVRANKKLEHENIVRIIDCDEVNGRYFMAMEYIDGYTMQDLLKKVPIIPVQCTLFIVKSILKGLAYSHSKKIVHRDMKPSNILLSKSGDVKISDFGISKITDFTKLTQTGSVLGTPAYMSPEQAKGQQISYSSDIFSVGIMLYEALMGENPFYSDNPTTAILNILQKEPEPALDLNPSVSPAIEQLIERMIDKDPQKRFSHAEDVISFIEAIEMNENISIDQQTFKDFINDPAAMTEVLYEREVDAILSHAESLIIQGEPFFDQAIWDYYRVLFMQPHNEKAKMEIADLCKKKGYNIETVKTQKILQLEEALANNPESTPLLMQLAKLHRLEGNFFEVIRYYRKMKKIKVTDGYMKGQVDSLIQDKTLTRRIISTMAMDESAQTLVDKSIKTQSVYSLETAPKLDVLTVQPAKPQKKLPLGVFMVAGTVVAALFFFWFLLSSVEKTKESIKEKQGGMVDREKITELMQNSEMNVPSEVKSIFNQAENSLMNSDLKKAEMLFKELEKRKIQSIHDQVLFRLIIIQKQSGQFEPALDYVQRLLARNPHPALVLFAKLERAQIYGLQNRSYDREMEYDDIVPQLSQIPEIALRVQILVEYGSILKESGKYDKALRTTQTILDDYKGLEFHQVARTLRAEIFQKQGYLEKAKQQYQKVLELSSPDMEAYKSAKEQIGILDKEILERGDTPSDDLLTEERLLYSD